MVDIATKHTSLYDAEMKETIDRVFQDIIECLHNQDKDETLLPSNTEMDEAARSA